MLVKIALILAALGALVVMLRGKSGNRGGKTEAKPGSSKTLSSTKCETCGIYLPAGQSCDCADRS